MKIKFFELDESANCWRFVAVSRIQNNTARRIALVATLPLLLLYYPWIIVLMTAWHALILLCAPFYAAWRFFPSETFRSFAKRWSVPMEHAP